MLYFNCSKCGLCLSDCPAYQRTKNEQYSPKSLIINNYHNSKDNLDFIWKQCSMCRSQCLALSKCPMGIKFDEVKKELGR
ncbi:4Fe-4S dicluster domain-containing protein [Enterococcus termitis]|uniref:4Fe-4S ferredoxin-type domain-containing protein n=1 Tax=Enterococcus termitis TaxID=332950 RepID=A0A1E5GVS9_9ENTE|nr:hypothetical protein BCR25_03875 [Enterococcus termitis]